MRDRLTNVLRSPLLHFLVIGAVIYAAYAATNSAETVESSSTIKVTAGELGWLEESWTKRWNRPPTPAERQGLIDQHVRETVLYREALAMGLDKDDVIIRRRLGQKLEFLFQDLADSNPPTDEEVRDYFAANRDRYREPEVMTLTHVFVDPDRRGDQTLTDARDILARLEALEPPTDGADELGDPFMLQAYYPERSEGELAKLFGGGFVQSVFELAPGRWHGPVLSGYGVHLVYVHGRTQSPPPDFNSVRDRVAEDLQSEKRQEFNDEYVASLLARYDVIIEDEVSDEIVSNR